MTLIVVNNNFLSLISTTTLYTKKLSIYKISLTFCVVYISAIHPGLIFISSLSEMLPFVKKINEIIGAWSCLVLCEG